MSNGNQVSVEHVPANGITIEVAVAGEGPAMLLLHGFPHTWRVWSAVIPLLVANGRRVIAPDLRGLGGTSRARSGYDAQTLSRDGESLLAAMGVDSADVVGLDLGGPVAVMLALRRPDLVRRLAVLESSLPGSEGFSPPWWFGFHAVPGLAEQVLAGHEGEYLDFFYRIGTVSGVPSSVRDEFVSAYSGAESLRCAFEHYRAFRVSAQQFQARTAETGLPMPVLAIGAAPVGETTYRQLSSIGSDVRSAQIADCGHIIPLDQPTRLAELLTAFLA